MRGRFDARLCRLELAFQKDDGPAGPGLAALLEWAKKHPRQPWDVDDEDEEPTSLTELLREAREWVAREKGQQYGTD
jgi:hypothetical protein